MSKTTQHTVFGEPNHEQLHIEATADTIKPVFAYPRKLVDECKLNVTHNGLEYTAVDPANVAMLGLNVPPEAFETYSVEETTMGIDLKSVMGALRAGRQKESDEITLTRDGNMLKSRIHRDYSGTQLSLENRLKLIDPDSIRQEPEIPDIELNGEATIPRRMFDDIINQVDYYGEHIQIGAQGNNLVIDTETDTEATTAVVEDVVNNSGSDEVSSLFSMDYMKDAIKAFATIGVDELSLKFGTDLPVRIDFEKELNGATVTGNWFMAPRMRDE